MAIPNWVTPLFRAIDAKDTDGFISHLADDVRFRFGNADTVQGRNMVEAIIGSFFQAITGLRHELLEGWKIDGTTIVRGTVTYTRHDGSTLEVPFANVMKHNGDTIDEYLIYVDSSRLFAG
jgi:ketosteroid isomerase-like protein